MCVKASFKPARCIGIVRRSWNPSSRYDTPHEPYDAERFKRAREDGVPEALVVPVPGPKGAIGVGWFGSATNSRSDLHKHRFTIQVICMAGFYRLKTSLPLLKNLLNGD